MIYNVSTYISHLEWGLILDQIYYRTKDITGNKEGRYMIMKGPIHQEDIILNLSAQNNRNNLKQKRWNSKEKISPNSKKSNRGEGHGFAVQEGEWRRKGGGGEKEKFQVTSIWNFRTFIIIKSTIFRQRDKRAQIKDQTNIEFIKAILEVKGHALMASKLWGNLPNVALSTLSKLSIKIVKKKKKNQSSCTPSQKASVRHTWWNWRH